MIISQNAKKIGRPIVIYPYPAFYRDSEGWKDVELAITESKEWETDRKNITNNFKTYFNDKSDLANPTLASFEYDGKWINYKMVDATPSETLTEGNKVSYLNVYPDTDLIYTVTHRGLKEEIIVKTAEAMRDSYEFTIKTNTKFADFNTVAFMTDADGKRGAVEISLSQAEYKAKAYESVCLIPDAEFLKTAVYPITIDPTTTIQPATSDTYVAEDSPTSNFSTDIDLTVGNVIDQYIGLLKWDLSAYNEIVSATMALVRYDGANNTSRDFSVHKVTEAFDASTVTWNTKPSYSGALDTTAVLGDATYEWDVSACVSNSTDNYGIALIGDDAVTADTYKVFASSEYVIDTDDRPKLTIISRNDAPTITAPASTDEDAPTVYLDELTPNITASLDGYTITKYQVLIYDSDDNLYFDSGEVTDTEIDYDVPISADLEYNKTYGIKVKALDNDGYWTEISTEHFFQCGMTAVSDLTTTDVTAGIKLEWTASTCEGITGYNVYRHDGEVVAIDEDCSAIITPGNTADGELIATFGGLSVGNAVINNDFSDGTTGWDGYNSTLSYLNNILTTTGDGTSVFFRPYQAMGNIYASDDYFFAYAKIRVVSSAVNAISIKLVLRDGGGTQFIASELSSYVENEWFYIYGKVRCTENLNNDLNIYIQLLYASPASNALNSTIEVDGLAGVYAINMTQYGIADFTEAQMLDIVHSMSAGTDIQNAIVNVAAKSEDETESNTVDTNITLRRIKSTQDTLTTDGLTTRKISSGEAVVGVVAVNVTNYPTAKTGGYWYNDITGGIVETGIVGTDSTSASGTLYYELTTPTYTMYDFDTIETYANGTITNNEIPPSVLGYTTEAFTLLDSTTDNTFTDYKVESEKDYYHTVKVKEGTNESPQPTPLQNAVTYSGWYLDGLSLNIRYGTYSRQRRKHVTSRAILGQAKNTVQDAGYGGNIIRLTAQIFSEAEMETLENALDTTDALILHHDSVGQWKVKESTDLQVNYPNEFRLIPLTFEEVE